MARGALLYHDNASPHPGRTTEDRIQELRWEFPEHPLYSPVMALIDFHLFGLLETPP
jgi:hypothetical protein